MFSKNMYEGIAKILEFRATHGGVNHVKQINAHLALGWVILAIHERGYDDTAIGEGAQSFSIFILGHKDIDGPVPQVPKVVYE